MRSTSAIPDNPWPAEMTITIKDDTSSLIELLWVREAWGLQPSGDIPPRLTRTPTRLTGKLADERWEEAWTPLWAACVDHAGHSIEGTLARLQAAPPVSAERDQLLRRLVGPTWRERFGERAFDESFETWQQQWFDDIVRSHTVLLEESPERRVVKDLAAAWEAGLTTVVTIPCTGDYTRIISDTAMLVTDDTRRDPLRYAIALRAFRHGEPS